MCHNAISHKQLYMTFEQCKVLISNSYLWIQILILVEHFSLINNTHCTYTHTILHISVFNTTLLKSLKDCFWKSKFYLRYKVTSVVRWKRKLDSKTLFCIMSVLTTSSFLVPRRKQDNPLRVHKLHTFTSKKQKHFFLGFPILVS